MEERVIHHPGKGFSHRIEQVRQRKYNMEVANGEDIDTAIEQPLFAFGVLAFGAMAITTRVIGDDSVFTVRTLEQMTAKGASTALEDIGDGFFDHLG